MREIKFRAWGIYGFGSKASMKRFDLSDVPSLGDSVPVMQFTGLKDKNGVEIYEGDIIRQESGSPAIEDDISVIKFGFYKYEDEYNPDSGYGWYTETVKGYGRGEIGGIGNPEWTTFFEVIGNIYENPELLEGGSKCG